MARSSPDREMRVRNPKNSALDIYGCIGSAC
jgi:hypothetical protein